MTTALRYLPATDQAWLTLVAGHRVLVVEASAAASADLLFSSLAGEASQPILDELTAAGPALTPSFALLTLDVSEVTGLASLHCVVRGSTTLTVDTVNGSESIDETTATAGVERTFSDVTAFSLGATDATSLSLPLETGAAWSTAVTWQGTAALVAEAAAAQPVAAPTEEPSEVNDSTVVMDNRLKRPSAAAPAAPVESEVNDSTVVMDDRLKRPRAGAAPAASAEPEVNDSTVVMDDRLKRPRIGAVPSLRPSTAKHAASPEPPTPVPHVPALPETAEPDTVAADEAPDHTVVIDRPAPAPPVVDDEHDGATVVVDRSAFAASKKPAPEPAPAVPRAPSYYLSLSTGERAPLDQPVLVGRAPSSPKEASGPIPRLVPIPGDKDISRTHVRFALEGDSIVVTDLHSRNGTSIALPGRSPQRLRGGEPTTVLVGTLVDLGNGITITLLEE